MVRKILMTLAIATVIAPAAAAKPGPPPALVWAPGVEISYTETVRDGLGRVVSVTRRDGIRPGQPFGTAVTSGSSPEEATAIDADSDLAAVAKRPAALRRACCSSGGSDVVELTLTKKTLLGFVAWRWHQVKYWTWNYPNITSVNAGAGFFDVDGQQFVNYDANGYGWYYTWAGSSLGGHYTYRQGSISNCIFRYGCISTSYPWAQIWVNGNGAWTGNAGGA